MLRLLASDIMTGGRKWADDFTTLDLSAAATNPLVVRRSLSDDEDRDAEVPTVGTRPQTTCCVPDRPINVGNVRSLPDSPIQRLTCVQAD